MVAPIGMYHGFQAFAIFADLSAVTHRWVLASGDPDFPADFEQFRLLAAILTVLVAGLGVSTVVVAISRLLGRGSATRYWSALTILSLVVHALRLLAQHIDRTLTGQLALMRQ